MALGSSAASQALGYLYQFERSIYWLSHPDIEYVAVETDDDVVAKLLEGNNLEKIFEQDKSVLSNSNPFSNSSLNLWKTLSIWLSILKKNPKINARFVLSTNKRVSNTCIIYKLHQSNTYHNYRSDKTTLKSFYDDLFFVGNKLKGKGKEIFLKIQSEYTAEDVLELLSKIVLSVDNFQNDRQKFKESIRDNLRIGSQVPFNSIYNRILGWVINKTIEAWLLRKEGIIKSSELIDIKDHFVKESIERPFIEQAVSALPIFDHQRNEQWDKNFIRQLELIECDDDEKIEAIDDFLRASMERDRWAENGSIPCNTDISEFEKELLRSWKIDSKQQILANKYSSHSSIDIGNLIYNASRKSNGFSLAGYPVLQSYTTLGGFQILADNLKIGWHPEWKNELKVEK
nr:ABC-three component system protein [uncultured Pedobacter sp.]